MCRYFLALFLFIGYHDSMVSQNTIGVLLNSERASEGYTLYTPIQYTSSYLIDNCGQVINQWDSEYSAGLASYLLPGGRLLRAGRNANSGFSSAGRGGILQIFNWDGTLDWEAVVDDDTYGAHHDVEPTSYGTILLLRWERRTEAEYIQAGKNPDWIPANLWMPSVVEIRPTIMGEFDIIWEWHLFDHLVQSFDPSKDNFGLPSENPRKMDINYENLTITDWAHCNSIMLNEDRNELIISARNLNEVWILDHSTSSLEAALDIGGNQGLGGQFLARFGNQNTYLEEDVELLFDGQHDVKIFNDENDDLVLQVFSNNISTIKKSQIIEVRPILDASGRYLLRDNRFEIAEDTFRLESNDDLDFNSKIMSSVQNLPNGNKLINSGNDSKFFEITPQEELVWQYVGPVSLFGPNPQGSEITGSTFNLIKYPSDDPIFDGLDTSVKAEAIEINPNLVNCGIVSSTNIVNFNIEVYPTLFDQQLTLENRNAESLYIECFDLIGNRKFASEFHGNLNINTANWAEGIYIIKVNQDDAFQTFRVIKTSY